MCADSWDFIRSIMSLKTVLSANSQLSFLYIYSGQKYKNEDDAIVMIM